MPSFWIRVGRVACVFTLTGALTGILIAAGEPNLGWREICTHPWVYRAAISGLLGGLAWAPVLSWTRLWGVRPLEEAKVRTERRWALVIGLLLGLCGTANGFNVWQRIEDNGIARVDLGDNAEVLEDWTFDRIRDGQEARYLRLGVDAVVPLPLVTATNVTATPVAQPAARALVGIMGEVGLRHAQNISLARIRKLRMVFLEEGLSGLETKLESGVRGTQASIRYTEWLPIDSTDAVTTTMGAIPDIEQGEISEIIETDSGYQLVQRLETRPRYGQSALLLPGVLDTAGFVSTMAFALATLLIVIRRFGSAAATLVMVLGAVVHQLYEEPSLLTISVQDVPDGPFRSFVLTPQSTHWPLLSLACAAIGLLLTLRVTTINHRELHHFREAFRTIESKTTKQGLLRTIQLFFRNFRVLLPSPFSAAVLLTAFLNGLVICFLTGVVAGATSTFLYVQIFPQAEVLGSRQVLLLLVVSYWPILLLGSGCAGVICAWWNRKPRFREGTAISKR